jgi:uncharacterized Zn-binding protein involved in type VI secretion
MVRRFDICDGDTTTARGVVHASSRVDWLDGRAVAYEGDPVWCPACETTGRIVCAGERLSSRGRDGRQAALSGDWCLCSCTQSPLLIESQCRSGGEQPGSNRSSLPPGDASGQHEPQPAATEKYRNAG